MSRYLSIFAVALLAAAPLRAESFASWAAKGRRLQNQGDEQDALGAYTQALKLWKRVDGAGAKARVLSARAELLEKDRQWSKAIDDLTAAARISTRTASYPYRVGRDYLEISRPADAITWFYKATKLDFNFKEAYYDRARAYETTGDLEFAREDYKTACQLGVKAACRRRKTLASGGKSAPGRAPDEFAARKRAPKKGPVELRRGKAKVSKKDVDDFPSCLAALGKCVDDGGAFGDCVDKTTLCPKNCVAMFKSLANSQSEAEAFREVFKPDSACLSGSTGVTILSAGDAAPADAGSPDAPPSDASPQEGQ